MPFSEPAEREKLHHRSIQCEGYRRADGLWDIEATMTDTKTYAYSNRDRGEVEAGEPVHLMLLRLTLDLDMTIVAVHADMEYSPFNMCRGARDIMQNLVGLQIKSGWLREARTQRIGKWESCTHLFELLAPLSTVAYQTMHRALEEARKKKAAAAGADGGGDGKKTRPRIINQCYSLASDSPIVKLEWPEFYTGAD